MSKRRPLWTIGAGSVLLVIVSQWQLDVTRMRSAPASFPPAHGLRMLERLPAAFVPNLGQWEHHARYVTRVGGGTAFLDESGFLLSWPTAAQSGRQCGAAVRLRLVGAGAAELVAERRLPGTHSYFLGNDPARWRGDVPLYGAVRYRGAWQGVDVVCYERERHLEYDVVLEPGADLAAVEFAVEGARSLHIDADGAVVVATAGGPLRLTRPLTYEQGHGRRREIAAHYELRGEHRFGFAAPRWRRELPLVLDPGILWSTFLGAQNGDDALEVSVDGNGIVTVGGRTASTAYPTTVGAWDTSYNGNYDAFVTRLDPSLPGAQQLRYSTFLGGGWGEGLGGISVGATGVVTIAGGTLSPNFPTTPDAWDSSYNGNGDLFVARLDPSLPGAQQLVYSTFLGGTAEEGATALAVDAAGVATIAGSTVSSDYPTTAAAWDTSPNGSTDCLVTRLDPSLPAAQQLLYSTFLGGINRDTAAADGGGMSVDGAGVVTIGGFTDSLDFPTTVGAWDTSYNGSGDVFVARLDPSLPPAQQLRYATFVGTSATERGVAVAVEATGAIIIAGTTVSPNFPTTPGAWDTSYNAGADCFVAALLPSLPGSQQLLYSTFVGGNGDDYPWRIAVDSDRVMTLVGGTFSMDFPTTSGAWDTAYDGSGDGFVTRLDPSLPAAQQLRYSTFVGGSASDGVNALAVDASGFATIVGGTFSVNFPTTPAAFLAAHGGALYLDGFVARLDLLPTGVSAYGASTAGCTGPLRIGVGAWPQVGNASFLFTCAGAPANSLGLLAVGTAGLTAPVPLAGAGVWIDVQSPVFTVLLSSSSLGSAYAPAPIPPAPALAGLQAFAQFFWTDPCAPAGVSASNALAVTVQP